MKMHCETCCADMAHRYNDGVWVHGWHPSGSTHPYVFPSRCLPGTIVLRRPYPALTPGTLPGRSSREGLSPPPIPWAFPGRSSREGPWGGGWIRSSRDDRPGKALGGEALRPSRDDRPGKGLGKGEGGSDPGKLPQDGMGIVAWPGRNYGARGSCFCFVYVAHTATGCVKLSNTLRSAVK